MSHWEAAKETQAEVRAAIRNVTDEPNPERFRLYRLCDCTTCEGTGKVLRMQYEATPNDPGDVYPIGRARVRCPDCRGEGRTRDLVAAAATPEAVGVALVTLGREGEWDECPVGVLDTMGEPGAKWIVRPWLPSARNLSDAGRTLAHAPRKGKT